MATEGTPAVDLTGKGIVISGGAGGIGIATAHKLAGLGASVALFDRGEDHVAAAVDQLGGLGSTVIGRCVDVADEAAVEEALDETATAFGGIDGVVTAAGVRPKVTTRVRYSISTFGSRRFGSTSGARSCWHGPRRGG